MYRPHLTNYNFNNSSISHKKPKIEFFRSSLNHLNAKFKLLASKFKTFRTQTHRESQDQWRKKTSQHKIEAESTSQLIERSTHWALHKENKSTPTARARSRSWNRPSSPHSGGGYRRLRRTPARSRARRLGRRESRWRPTGDRLILGILDLRGIGRGWREPPLDFGGEIWGIGEGTFFWGGFVRIYWNWIVEVEFEWRGWTRGCIWLAEGCQLGLWTGTRFNARLLDWTGPTGEIGRTFRWLDNWLQFTKGFSSNCTLYTLFFKK